MELILVRHGKTEYNEQQKYCGALDPSLSEKGRAELETAEVRRFLEENPPELVFSSPMKRALETADLLCQDFPALPLLVVPELRECDFGDFEGRAFEGDLEHDPAYQAWVDGHCEDPIPGGDFPDRFREDAVVGFESVIETCQTEGIERAMVVTHGGVIGGVLEAVATPHRDWYEYRVPNGGYVVLELPDHIKTMGGGATC
ncbi:MAG: histidine phosphatase family protein [Clostridia bacterium]|nr:histidine phosphatase family protein [Clostridia bacterium]MBR1705058.1 histidine phosphatase family protein [Clostridia bacterium]